MWKLIKMMIAIALWPLAWAMSVSTYALSQPIHESSMETSWATWSLPFGFLVWVVIFFFLPRPVRTYVLGHELTHALWAVMMGGRVGKMKVGSKGGHVELSNSNFIISLAPYFFPFYTVLLVALFYLAGYWIEMDPFRIWWMFAIGLTWSFHITFTIHMLTQHQPDVQDHGRIFSFTVIYIMNVLVIALMMIFLGDAGLLHYGDRLGHETAKAYSISLHAVEQAWAAVARMIENIK